MQVHEPEFTGSSCPVDAPNSSLLNRRDNPLSKKGTSDVCPDGLDGRIADSERVAIDTH